MAAKRILIVGAGWLGLPLGKMLGAAGHFVTGTTTQAGKCAAIEAAGMQSLLLDLDAADQADLPHADVLVVTIPSRGGEAAGIARMQALAGMAERARIPHVIHCSSTAVYPELCRDVDVADAADIPSPHSGVRLLRLEQVLSEHRAFQTTVLRLGGLYGPGRDPAHFLKPGHIHHGADNPVNMAHQDDCIEAVRAVIARAAWGKCYNVVSPLEMTRREFYAQACKAAGVAEPLWSGEGAPWKRVLGWRF